MFKIIIISEVTIVLAMEKARICPLCAKNTESGTQKAAYIINMHQGKP
jgi:hypothetical protein